MKQATSGTRGPQIDDRGQVTGHEATERAGRRPEAHVNALGRLPDDLELLRQILKLNRHAEGALDDAVASDDEPQHRRNANRQELEPDVPQEWQRHQLSEE
jgi:hypothetical protein